MSQREGDAQQEPRPDGTELRGASSPTELDFGAFIDRAVIDGRAAAGEQPDVLAPILEEDPLQFAARAFTRALAQTHSALVSSRDVIDCLGNMLQRQLQQGSQGSSPSPPKPPRVVC